MTRLTVGGSGTTRRRMKPETERLAEQLAFGDPDRTTPVHDDICLWLDERLHEDEFLLKLTGRCLSWDQTTVEYHATEYVTAFKKLFEKELPPMPDLDSREWQRKTWEDERQRRNGWNEFWRINRELPAPPPPSTVLLATTWEKAIASPGQKWVSGFIDLTAEILIDRLRGLKPAPNLWEKPALPTWEIYNWEQTYAFEVKSSIPSLGELIRQIRYYETKFEASRFFVVAPDDRYAEKLLEQEIGFIHYPSGGITR